MTLGHFGSSRAGTKPLAFYQTCVLPNGSEIFAEVAIEPDELTRGLMFREKLEPNEGMLFVHPATGHHSVWMRNMLMPLDVVWMSDTGVIVEIVTGATPCKSDECPSYGGTKLSAYTLELPAGSVKRNQLKTGDKIRW